MSSHQPVVVIGVGNDFRQDDGVGLVVARRVQSAAGHVRVVVGIPDGTRMIDVWDGADLAVVVDCTSAAGQPGRVHCFEALHEAIPEGVFRSFSTHCFSIRSTFDLARTLDRLPQRLVVYGIEGERFDMGEGLSPQVGLAAEQVTSRIIDEIDAGDSLKETE